MASGLRRPRKKEERMKSRILSTFVLLGAVMTSPSYAGDTPAPRTDLSGGSEAGTVQFPERATIEGRIVSVEPESGRFVLDTADGPISLVTTPEALAGVNVGDIVRVALTTEESSD
jgi:hypothetical protein